jgi:hypothetical protein
MARQLGVGREETGSLTELGEGIGAVSATCGSRDELGSESGPGVGAWERGIGVGPWDRRGSYDYSGVSMY